MRLAGVFFLGVMSLVSAVAVESGTTSRLEGRVVDDQGGPLAGAEVTISSESLIGGAQFAITEADGGFAFRFLLVGEYTVNAEVVGHTPATATARVQLDRKAWVTLRLIPVTLRLRDRGDGRCADHRPRPDHHRRGLW